MKKVLGVICLSFGVVACSGEIEPKEPTVARKAEFTSIPQCLIYVQMDVKPKLKIVEDTPNKTWGGFEGTDGSFSCELIKTGSRGTYVEGHYQVYESVLRK